ncbi:MAG: type II toxin-antitoxin system VapC family toxin [Actinomycetota bacterium]|nr:type II toxin-antitoxin system VapC family toxin [Actinomycetota bacterium]HZY66219.1 type II toxin-antitoxin system VapC family toxin [Rubrobacteraceae bacterium]
MIVLDASAAVAVFLNSGPMVARLRRRIAETDETLHVPHLFDVEMLHVLRRHSLVGNLSEARGRLALDRLSNTKLVRYPHTILMKRIWSLRDNLTAYDAAYVALAEALDAPLVTSDARLARTPGIRAAVEVYGQ